MLNEPAIEPEAKPHTYICMHLATEVVDDLTRARLTHAGVESIQNAGPYRAYAVIDGSTKMLAKVAAQLQVKEVWFEDPPADAAASAQ